MQKTVIMIGQLKKIIISICMLATTISTNAQGSGWNVNPYDYPYDMTVYGQLVIDDITVVDYSNFEIGAFVGAECRGLAEANNKDNYSWLYFRIRSNTTSGEKVEFKVYNKSDNTIRKIEQSIIFESETTNGLPCNPFTFTLASQLFTITAKSSEESMGTVSLSHSGEVELGTNIEAKATTTCEGYFFINWTDANGNVVSTDNPFTFTLSSDIELTANFKANQYNVKFIVNGETVSEETLEYGAEIITPEAPEIEGYTFTEWSPEVSATVPANDVSYEALYDVNTYKVTYYINDVVVKIDYVNFGEEIPVYEPTIEDNMKFDGWIENIPSVMPAKDIEIHGTTSIIDTSIDNIVANYGDSFIIYDLSGKAIKKLNNKSDISNVPSGIYIVNGMKIYIRNY